MSPQHIFDLEEWQSTFTTSESRTEWLLCWKLTLFYDLGWSRRFSTLPAVVIVWKKANSSNHWVTAKCSPEAHRLFLNTRRPGWWNQASDGSPVEDTLKAKRVSYVFLEVCYFSIFVSNASGNLPLFWPAPSRFSSCFTRAFKLIKVSSLLR